ncbi:family 78 glycoside hydrolase catalytic domain [Gemmatimonadota bacterium]
MLIVPALCVQAQGVAPDPPTGLLTNHTRNPLHLDSEAPFFTWQVNDTDRNEIQTAYQIVAGLSAPGVGIPPQPVWDSGEVRSTRSVAVLWSGPALEPDTRYWWRVRTWDRDGNISPWSEPASFETGLPGNRFSARYIWDGSENVNDYAYFRSEFTVPSAIGQAKVFITAHDDYRLFVNGREVGRGPARNDPYRYGQYNAWDVTDLLGSGENVLAVITHWHGMFNVSGVNAHPALIVEARITTTEGGPIISIGSDLSWKVLSRTPWRESGFTNFGGAGGAGNRAAEVHDARLEPEGWKEIGFDDSTWENAVEVDRPAFQLYPQMVGNQRVQERLDPISIERSGSAWIVDFGKCITGWPELLMSEQAAGDSVTVRYFQGEGTTGPAGWDRYICRGGQESWSPDTGYTSFRTIRIEGYRGCLTAGRICGMWAYTDAEVAGAFGTSDPTVNAIHEMSERSARQSVQMGMISVDANREQASWTADSWIIGNTLLANHRNSPVVRKTILDYAGEQLDNGNFYAASPAAKRKIPEWAFYWPMLLWNQHLWYGDTLLLRDQFGNLERMIGFFEPKRDRKTGLLHYTGNWQITDLPGGAYIDQFSPALTAQNCQYYHVLTIASRVASVLGKTSASIRYGRMAREMRRDINQHLFDGVSRYRDSLGSEEYHQLPSTWALRYDIVPTDRREAVIEYVKSRGFEPHVYGADCFFDAMYLAGEGAWLLDLLTETGQGRWEWMAANNGRVGTEDWGTGEWNHAWSSSPGSFLPKHVGGIAPTSAAFSTFIVRPVVEGDLTFAETTMPTVRGDITTRWEKLPGGKSLILEVSVPANTEAEIYLPTMGLTDFQVEESGTVLPLDSRYRGEVEGILSLVREDDYLEITIGSGSYHFVLKK